MIKFAIGVIVVLLIAQAGFNFYLGTTSVTKKQFNEFVEEYRQDIDTLKTNQDSLIDGQITIIKDVKQLHTDNDSILKGQKAIYKHISNRAEKPTTDDGTFSEIIKFLKND